MKNFWILIAGLALTVTLLCAMGCDEQTPNEQTSEEPDFNLIFKYGVMARNKLDTFQGTYTKDMVMDPPITVELSLSEGEREIIYQKMVEIEFFSYPDEFSVSVPPGELVGIVTPYASYYFKVEYNSQIKELRWEDEITNPDEKAERLRELIKLIREIVESKGEYKELPEPTSAYL
jgi:hypothetical protein